LWTFDVCTLWKSIDYPKRSFLLMLCTKICHFKTIKRNLTICILWMCVPCRNKCRESRKTWIQCIFFLLIYLRTSIWWTKNRSRTMLWILFKFNLNNRTLNQWSKSFSFRWLWSLSSGYKLIIKRIIQWIIQSC
jgi:hypothetical protein